MCIKVPLTTDTAYSTFGLHTVVLVHCSIFTFNSVIMDCVVAATYLKNLLVAHGNAEAQVSALGKLSLCSYIVLANVDMQHYLIYHFLMKSVFDIP